MIRHRGKTNRNQECTPGYYNFEGESNRRQDGNYNGGFRTYFNHQGTVRAEMDRHCRPTPPRPYQLVSTPTFTGPDGDR